MSDPRAAGVPVTGVSELVLEVVDLDAAEEFYAGVLGLPVVERWPDREAIWVMAGDRTRIGLWRPQVGLAGGRGGVHVHFAMHIGEDALRRRRGPAARTRRRRRGDRLRRRRPSRLRDRPGWQRGRAVDLGRSRAPALTAARVAAEHGGRESVRKTQRIPTTVAMSLLLLAVLSAPTQAATVSVESSTLDVRAAPGEQNQLTHRSIDGHGPHRPPHRRPRLRRHPDRGGLRPDHRRLRRCG